MSMSDENEYRPFILNNIEVWDTNKKYNIGDEVLYNSLIMISIIDENDYIPVWPGNPFWRLKVTDTKRSK